MLLESGRVCIKTMGHEANQKCVIVEPAGENFVIVAGPRVKRRKCNVSHLEILPQKLEMKKGASDAEIIEMLLKAGLITEKDLPGKPAGYIPKPPASAKAEKPKSEKPKAAAKKAASAKK